jgi:hypothetical protein
LKIKELNELNCGPRCHAKVLSFDWAAFSLLNNLVCTLSPGSLHLHLMASSEVLHTDPTNGHINYAGHADNSDVRDVEHEDTTNTSAVKPTDRPEQGVSVTGFEEAHTEQHEEPQSAQPEGTAPSPVLDHPTDSQPTAPSSQHKPTGSPTKRPPPTVQTSTGKSTVSGPPTPQVKKVLVRFVNL